MRAFSLIKKKTKSGMGNIFSGFWIKHHDFGSIADGERQIRIDKESKIFSEYFPNGLSIEKNADIVFKKNTLYLRDRILFTTKGDQIPIIIIVSGNVEGDINIMGSNIVNSNSSSAVGGNVIIGSNIIFDQNECVSHNKVFVKGNVSGNISTTNSEITVMGSVTMKSGYVTTSNGSISCGNIIGANEISTTNSSITINGDCHGKVSTTNGGITADVIYGDAKTSNGKIVIAGKNHGKKRKREELESEYKDD